MTTALESLAPSIAHLRTIATPATDYRVLPFGVDAIDSRLGAGAACRRAPQGISAQRRNGR